jgi:hypothetical protein
MSFSVSFATVRHEDKQETRLSLPRLDRRPAICEHGPWRSTRGTELAEQLRDALASAGAAPEGGGNMVEDRIANLERLSKLRESGVLSDAEFEAEKARILSGS